LIRFIFYKYFRIRKLYFPYSLLIVWALVQMFLLHTNGIFTQMEAAKYIYHAKYFLNHGSFVTNNYWLYSTIIFLIALCIKLKLSFAFVVAIQFIVNLIALFMFYNLSFHFLRNRKLAWITSFLLACNIFYQWYNTFLYTESLFFSLTVIYSSYLLTLKRLRVRDMIFIGFLLALLSFTRPTGILFLVPTIFYIYYRFMNPLKAYVKTAFVIAWLGIFLFVLNRMMQTGGSLKFMVPFIKENVICGLDTVTSVPVNLPENGNSLWGLIQYIFMNSSQFLHLAVLKTMSFWGILRPYYSLPHNIGLAIMFYSFYVLGIVGLVIKWKEKDKRLIFLLGIILLYWVTTMLTCDDWHSRFFLTLTPFIFLLGMSSFINNSWKKVK